jgi:hypothetical protein
MIDVMNNVFSYDYIAQSLALFAIRCTSEVQWSSKHKDSPGRLASLLQGVCVGAWILNNMYFKALASTSIYFILDCLLNISLGKGSGVTHAHHLLGLALCTYSIVTSSFLDNGIQGQITRALIQMETTNISVQGALLMYHEYNYVHLMIPAALHFFVVRILVLGYHVHPMNSSVWKVVTSKFMIGLWSTTLLMWIIQMFWFIIWIQHIVKKLS